MSILTKISDSWKSLTSQKANEDPPPGVDVPDPHADAIEMPEREPMVGFEPGGDDNT